jgi:ATP-binding cassette subfamily C (CFTR/MRP) protein 1
MLWQLLGPSVLAGIAVMVLTAPLNTFIMKKLSTIQKDMMKSKDARTKIMNEVLNGVRVIKFFAWEKSFIQKILDIRNTELKTIKRTLFLRALAVLFWTATPVLVSTVTFTIFRLDRGII